MRHSEKTRACTEREAAGHLYLLDLLSEPQPGEQFPPLHHPFGRADPVGEPDVDFAGVRDMLASGGRRCRLRVNSDLGHSWTAASPRQSTRPRFTRPNPASRLHTTDGPVSGGGWAVAELPRADWAPPPGTATAAWYRYRAGTVEREGGERPVPEAGRDRPSWAGCDRSAKPEHGSVVGVDLRFLSRQAGRERGLP